MAIQFQNDACTASLSKPTARMTRYCEAAQLVWALAAVGFHQNNTQIRIMS